MQIDIQKLEESSDKREQAIEAFKKTIDRLAERISKACKREEDIYLKAGKTNILFHHNSKTGAYKIDFHWSKTGCPGYHHLSKDNKLFEHLKAFAAVITPEMIDEIIEIINNETSVLESANELLTTAV